MKIPNAIYLHNNKIYVLSGVSIRTDGISNVINLIACYRRKGILEKVNEPPVRILDMDTFNVDGLQGFCCNLGWTNQSANETEILLSFFNVGGNV